MARHKSLIPKDFDGNYTEDMLTERQKQVLNFIRSYAQTVIFPVLILHNIYYRT